MSALQACAPAAEPEYLTPMQVAGKLQLSVKSVYRLVDSDPTMPATRVGGSIRFHRERLERWLRNCEQGRGRTDEQRSQKGASQ